MDTYNTSPTEKTYDLDDYVRIGGILETYDELVQELVDYDMQEWDLIDASECEFNTTALWLLGNRLVRSFNIKDILPKNKHGKWLWKLADNGWVDHICSECGYTENTDIHVSVGYRYCPNCGAYMGK